MTSAPSSELSSKVQRASMRLAQLQARQALHELRIKSKQRARDRRAGIQRRQALGEAVEAAGLGEWAPRDLASFLEAALAKATPRPSESARFQDKTTVAGPIR